mmetsp:Transcript_5962/g.22631  ORF Transcript_5962/g.22631 Transcript_5962/m.22631 type:complete len:119 (-) Transcript_5962:2555-2911(-)
MRKLMLGVEGHSGWNIQLLKEKHTAEFLRIILSKALCHDRIPTGLPIRMEPASAKNLFYLWHSTLQESVPRSLNSWVSSQSHSSISRQQLCHIWRLEHSSSNILRDQGCVCFERMRRS